MSARAMARNHRSRAADFLTTQRVAILDVAFAELDRRHVRHYESSGAEETRLRLDRLYDALLHAAETRDLGAVVAYAERVAAERYHSGYGLSEVQTAFNVLEEAIWTCVFAELNPSTHAEALSVVSTILGAAKDALARRYVALATQTHVPALDVDALLTGTERS
jgi:hypothetical protein